MTLKNMFNNWKECKKMSDNKFKEIKESSMTGLKKKIKESMN